MAIKINRVPEIHPETGKPTVIADRAAHKANKTEQEFDRDHDTFSI